MLTALFGDVCLRNGAVPETIAGWWKEIVQSYSEKGRHYHTLQHLANLNSELAAVRNLIQDFDAVLFALFYHDIVYNAKSQDNEVRSADLATARLADSALGPERIARVAAHIRATKGHTVSTDSDTNLFTDADLSILGKPADVYDVYAADVRKEYSMYPWLLYRKGRKKVLEHFLAMEHIYKTAFFHEKYEKPARENMRREWSGL